MEQKSPNTIWHSRSVDETVEGLQTNLSLGLTEAEAARRLEHYGPNALREQPSPEFWQRLLSQFQSFVIYILVFAAILSAALGDWVESAAIAAIVVLNAVLGVIQEGRAEEALAALKRLASPDAVILRDGHQKVIPASQVVPGDIVILEAGNYVPADVRLVETMNLKIEEASLTGESVPVDKRADLKVVTDSVIGDRKNMAYMSTVATYGRGRAVIVATGMSTEIGKIADMIQSTEDEDTPLQQRLDQLGRTLSVGALAICLLVGVVIFLRELTGDDDIKLFAALKDSLMTSVALAIASVPEGLPAIVTINLAIGMREMIRRNALIRRLPAVETLGSASAICSDKTGTLTQNQMTTTRLYAGGVRLDVSGEGYATQGSFSKNGERLDVKAFPSEVRRLLMAAMLSSDARLETSTNGASGFRMIGDPTEGALVVAAAKADIWRDQIETCYPRVNEIPFDSTRKRMSTIHKNEDNGNFIVFSKGAPEILLDHCDTVLENGQEVSLTSERREHIRSLNRDMANQALRVLAVAQRHMSNLPVEIVPETIEEHLTFVGLVGMIDPARPEVKPAIEKARHAGIRTVMVTGDYPDTARAIAQEIGLLRPGGQVVNGSELELMSSEELDNIIDDIDVFARVSPEHKVRIVEAFRARDYVVAMTGDGVNDAPALKRASIGVAMGIAGTDVTKETADMVLTDDNYVSIVSAVEQGRVIYSNIRKFVYFLLSCNLAEIAVIFLATVAGAPSPLTPIQLLWLNLLTDGAPALALGVEKGDPDIMDHPPRPVHEPIINRDMRIGMLIQTIIITAATLGAFILGRALDGDSWTLARTMAFVTLSSSELFRAYTSRSELYALHKIGILTNKYMQYAVSTSLVLLVAVLYIPFLQDVFDTVALTFVQWLYIIPLIFAPSIAAELTKAYLRWLHYKEEVQTAS
jgi:Ca2+-transporting ATPase